MKMNELPPTAKRVANSTCPEVNTQIRDQTICCLNTFNDADSAILTKQIDKLNQEWDVERITETKAAAMILLISLMGFLKNRSCSFLMSGAIGVFLMTHALQGWCPTLNILRKMGIRTADEIFIEKTVFKMLRGDFGQMSTKDPNQLLTMAEM